MEVTRDRCANEVDMGSGQEKTTYAKWSTRDNEILINCWLEVSNGLIIKTDQKCTQFWGQIADVFNQYNKSANMRSAQKLKSHWHQMCRSIKKFAGYYDKIKKEQPSGMSEEDVKRAAHILFESENNCSFKYVNEWQILRMQPKWLSVYESKNDVSKRTKVNISGHYVSSDNSDARTIDVDEIEEPRLPVRTKADQSKEKQKASPSEGSDFVHGVKSSHSGKMQETPNDRVDLLEKLVNKISEHDMLKREKIARMEEIEREKLARMERIEREKIARMEQIEREKMQADLAMKFLQTDVSNWPTKAREMAEAKKQLIMQKYFGDD